MEPQKPYSNIRRAPLLIMSLGGSLLAPDDIDAEFIYAWRDLLVSLLASSRQKMIVVTGGGGVARRYQRAYKTVLGKMNTEREVINELSDEIGIAATRLNATLVKACLGSACLNDLITDPEKAAMPTGAISVAGGWKAGFSTDAVAVELARRFSCDTVINLSNTDYIYSADPRVDKNAKPLEQISWREMRRLVGNEWLPGAHLPFDPIATQRAMELQLTVIVAGRNLNTLAKIVRGERFAGTIISPS